MPRIVEVIKSKINSNIYHLYIDIIELLGDANYSYSNNSEAASLVATGGDRSIKQGWVATVRSGIDQRDF